MYVEYVKVGKQIVTIRQNDSNSSFFFLLINARWSNFNFHFVGSSWKHNKRTDYRLFSPRVSNAKITVGWYNVNHVRTWGNTWKTHQTRDVTVQNKKKTFTRTIIIALCVCVYIENICILRSFNYYSHGDSHIAANGHFPPLEIRYECASRSDWQVSRVLGTSLQRR